MATRSFEEQKALLLEHNKGKFWTSLEEAKEELSIETGLVEVNSSGTVCGSVAARHYKMALLESPWRGVLRYVGCYGWQLRMKTELLEACHFCGGGIVHRESCREIC